MQYEKSLPKTYFHLPEIDKQSLSSFHLYVVRIKEDLGPHIRDKLYDYLKSKKIITNVHYIPIYRQPFYRDMGYKIKDFPDSELYYKTCLSLPIFPAFSKEMFNSVIEEINNFFEL